MILSINHIDKNRYLRKNSKAGGVIYKITNILTDDFYIGSSTNLYKRYYTHIYHMRKQKNTCIKLNRAVKKYGEENFKFEIISKCPIEYVLKMEQWFISNLKPSYNIALIAGSNFGIKRSEEVKLEKSKSQKNKWADPEYRKYHVEKLALNWKKGSKHHSAKVNEEMVISIKRLLSRSISSVEISKELDISLSIIKDIKRNKTWKHVTL